MSLHKRQVHPTYVEGCFGCKVQTLELNTGDAARDIPDKKWNSELQAYRDARAEGIQPSGTNMRDIEAAFLAVFFFIPFLASAIFSFTGSAFSYAAKKKMVK